MRTAPDIIIGGHDAVVRRQPVQCTPAVGQVSIRHTTLHGGSGAPVAWVSAAPGWLSYSMPPAVERAGTAGSADRLATRYSSVSQKRQEIGRTSCRVTERQYV